MNNLFNDKKLFIASIIITVLFALVILQAIDTSRHTAEHQSYVQAVEDEKKVAEAGELSEASAASTAAAEVYKLQSDKITDDISKLKKSLNVAYSKYDKASKVYTTSQTISSGTSFYDVAAPSIDELCTRYAQLTGEQCYRIEDNK